MHYRLYSAQKVFISSKICFRFSGFSFTVQILFIFSVDEEISYLVDIQFLSLQTMSDVSTYRHISEEAERSIQQQIDSSCSTDSTFVDWNSEWEDVEEDTNASPSPSSSSRLNSLIADKMEANEKLISIFRSNVEDNIRQSISAIHELVARWESNQSTAKGWDMLSKLENISPGTNKNKSQNTDEVRIYEYMSVCL